MGSSIVTSPRERSWSQMDERVHLLLLGELHGHMEPEHAPRLECLINDAFFLLSEQNKQPCQDSSARRGCFGLCGRFLLDAKD